VYELYGLRDEEIAVVEGDKPEVLLAAREADS
jgi:hypothetical protein